MTQFHLSYKPPANIDPAASLAILREELGYATTEITNNIADTAKLLAPVNMGILRSNIFAETTREPAGFLAEGKVYTGAAVQHYARPVEFGARPHWAPIAPLKLWAKRVWKDERKGYALQQAIARRGTRAQPYFMPAVEEGKIDAPGVMREALTRAVIRMQGGVV